MQEKQTIGSLFDRIAGSYDLLNHLLSLNIDRCWRKKAIQDMQPAKHVLDVAIGTADLTIELLRQSKTTHITGIDLSREMMAIGKKKVEDYCLKVVKSTKNSVGNHTSADDLAKSSTAHSQPTTKNTFPPIVSFLLGSALDMPFEDATFDAVTCAYGVRNFSDLDKGLKEMYRVLRPNGELMILEFSYPANRFIAWGYDLYFSHVLPLVGRLFSHDKTAYSYLNRSVKNFIWGNEMCNHLCAAGFQQVTFTPLTFGITTIYRAKK